jgi:hypothetical protein
MKRDCIDDATSSGPAAVGLFWYLHRRPAARAVRLMPAYRRIDRAQPYLVGRDRNHPAPRRRRGSTRSV